MVRPVQKPAPDSLIVEHLTRDSGGTDSNPSLVRHDFSHPVTTKSMRSEKKSTCI